jgi:hypothetical protein
MPDILVGYHENYNATTKETTRTPFMRPLIDVQNERLVALTAAVEEHVAAHMTPAQQRLLTAVYARAQGRNQANRKAKADTLLDWVEQTTLHLYALAAQVRAAQTLADIEAIRFDAAQYPAPLITARDVLTTEG